MRRCTKCHESKEPAEFHRNKKARDGRQSWCKACIKAHIASPEGKAYKLAYDRSEKGRATKRRVYQKYKYKTIARNRLALAVRKGKVIRPDNCSSCGVDCIPHGHHTNYNKVLDVVWLCKNCHVEAHNELRKQGIQIAYSENKL